MKLTIMTVDKALKGLTTAIKNLENARIAADKIVSQEYDKMITAQDKRNAAIKEARRAKAVADKLSSFISE